MQMYAASALLLLGIVLCQAEEAPSTAGETRRGRTSRILNVGSSDAEADTHRARTAKIISENATSEDVEARDSRALRVVELDKAISAELRNILKVSGRARAVSLADLLLWPFRMATPKPIENRQQNLTTINFDSAFDIIAAIDEVKCIPRVICEINASQNDKVTLDEFEKIIIKMFSKPHTKKETAAGKLYREAAAMGANLKSPLVCQNLYPKCQFASKVLRNALIGDPITREMP